GLAPQLGDLDRRFDRPDVEERTAAPGAIDRFELFEGEDAAARVLEALLVVGRVLLEELEQEALLLIEAAATLGTLKAVGGERLFVPEPFRAVAFALLRVGQRGR